MPSRQVGRRRRSRLTGGDPIVARPRGSAVVTFKPSFKLIVVGNEAPSPREADESMRDRLCVVPFAARPARPDRALEAKLVAEWPGILRWMIEGCLAWQAGGLGMPSSVLAATAACFEEADLVEQFLDEACDRSDPAWRESAADLYAAWSTFAEAAGEDRGTRRRFAAAMQRHGVARERTQAARLYRGVRLLRPEERPAA